MRKFRDVFTNLYYRNYPDNFGLEKFLFYYLIKYNLLKSVVNFIKDSKNDNIYICDVWGERWYDNILVKNILDSLWVKKNIFFDVIDQNIDFYQIWEAKTNIKINYIEKSFLDINQDKKLDSKYDIIICSEVIEHISSFEKEVFFCNFNYCLKENWLLVISCPNWTSIFKNLLVLYKAIKNKRKYFDEEFWNRYWHIDVPTIAEVSSLFMRKWFSLKKLLPTTISSSTKLNFFNKLITPLLMKILFPFSLFISTASCFIWIKEESVDYNKWYNKLDKNFKE